MWKLLFESVSLAVGINYDKNIQCGANKSAKKNLEWGSRGFFVHYLFTWKAVQASKFSIQSENDQNYSQNPLNPLIMSRLVIVVIATSYSANTIWPLHLDIMS